MTRLLVFGVLLWLLCLLHPATALSTKMPARSYCGDVPNALWQWRGYDVRFVASRPQQQQQQAKKKTAVVLVHGLFVNADHWRKTFPFLADQGFAVYALDMLGSGYSSKPLPYDPEAKRVSGRIEEEDIVVGSLGTTSGAVRPGTVSVPQRHPLDSPYNFHTWAEQVVEFCDEVVAENQVALVCNSIGCITGLLAATKRPDLVKGVQCVAPNFRELHKSENPKFAQPVTALIQKILRETVVGQFAFSQLATPSAVKQILKEPYFDPSNVDDDLVDALLTPLLQPNASAVVFDALSYSADPLPEQLLQHPAFVDHAIPVWVSLGLEDPWTPKPRILALDRFASVSRIDLLPACGHCPHDERPDLVNPLVLDFLHSIVDV